MSAPATARKTRLAIPTQLTCPHCGTTNRTEVADTRATARNSVWRRRRCRICKKSFTTIEQIEHSLDGKPKAGRAGLKIDRAGVLYVLRRLNLPVELADSILEADTA